MRRTSMCTRALSPLVLLGAACAGEIGGPSHADVSLLLPASEQSEAMLGIRGWEVRQGDLGVQLAGVSDDHTPLGSIFLATGTNADTGEDEILLAGDFGGIGSVNISTDTGALRDDTFTTLDPVGPWAAAATADLDDADQVGYVLPLIGGLAVRGMLYCARSPTACRAALGTATACARDVGRCVNRSIMGREARGEARRRIREAVSKDDFDGVFGGSGWNPSFESMVEVTPAADSWI